MPVTPKPSKAERTRTALQHAALARFLEQGVEATSVAEIAADAGVTERTFYRHYPSKQHILFSDYDARLDWFRRALSVRPPGESIATSVRIAVESFPYDDALQQIAVLRGKQLERDLVRAHIKTVQGEFAHEIEQHLRTRGAADPAPDTDYLIAVTAQCISAVMFTATETWFARGNLDTDELSHLVDLGLRTLRNGIS
ncbi:TetR family transcriptional regulator [Nocardia sp. ET3-3]|uniref:TetR family transcriptional regulator n=1 Tax=Nocardia terrae TaxID=2675851 RepID=A0A7K1V5A8_9NOCA|nr:TetR/AcrR family transcriptional regulator [Nocardia terrae]MVU81671.1 TetR family transcriptional regulator [Nocardia terrae]